MDEILNNSVFMHRMMGDSISADISETFRYSGIAKTDAPQPESDMYKLACRAQDVILSCMNPRSCYIRFDLSVSENDRGLSGEVKKISFGNKTIYSKDLANNLKGCHCVYLFSATLGPEVDRAIQKNSRLNPALSVFLQSAGAMYIEEYCNKLEEFLLEAEKKNGNAFVPRFSPGYGDVSLETQKIFFEILNCQKNLALTLNDSLIMSPEKSVTAFIGVKKEK
ncbi:MAG: hypothetical protein J6X37_02850 [Treponema sp.]|nr:hypothetical protein [Treponema sp.]